MHLMISNWTVSSIQSLDSTSWLSDENNSDIGDSNVRWFYGGDNFKILVA